jgi:hypothetical protein
VIPAIKKYGAAYFFHFLAIGGIKTKVYWRPLHKQFFCKIITVLGLI